VGLCVEPLARDADRGSWASSRPAALILPLDPNYPRERLAFMLADAGGPVLVTQSALLDRFA